MAFAIINFFPSQLGAQPPLVFDFYYLLRLSSNGKEKFCASPDLETEKLIYDRTIEREWSENTYLKRADNLSTRSKLSISSHFTITGKPTKNTFERAETKHRASGRRKNINNVLLLKQKSWRIWKKARRSEFSRWKRLWRAASCCRRRFCDWSRYDGIYGAGCWVEVMLARTRRIYFYAPLRLLCLSAQVEEFLSIDSGAESVDYRYFGVF